MNPDCAPSLSRFFFRRSVGVGLVAVLLASASYRLVPPSMFHHAEAVAAPAPTEQAVPAAVATVEPRDVVLWDEFSGRLEAVDRTDVWARVGGSEEHTSEYSALG